ncbi:putative plasmid maintenance system killer protein [Vibrio phage PhiImVa-1]|nr:putative plasmid maintenance system killer protein [Vibrio phage PhiImVa-1]
MKFKVKNIPNKAVKEAENILEQYLAGNIQARKTNGKKYLVLNVGRDYRLLNKGNKWVLMNHNKYNREIDK